MRICKKCRRGECTYEKMKAHLIHCRGKKGNVVDRIEWSAWVDYDNEGEGLNEKKLEFP